MGVQGIKLEEVKKCEDALDETLREVVEKGFEEGSTETVLHQVELSMQRRQRITLDWLYYHIWFHIVCMVEAHCLYSRLMSLLNRSEKTSRKEDYLKDLLRSISLTTIIS